MKHISLALSSPALARAVLEQLARLEDLTVSMATTDDDPDLVIAETLSAAPVPHLILGKSPGIVPPGSVGLSLPVRLGAVADQVRYLLSNRTKMAALSRDSITLGQFRLDPEDSQLVHSESGQIIRLTDKERLFILTLFDAPDHAMDRKGLLDAVWGYAQSAETHTLETHLYRLRQKIEPFAGQDLIVSVDGFYRLKV